MSDLISRSALLKKIAHHTMFDCLKHVTFESANTYEQVKGAMFELAQKAPAVDAVPVVRCRECQEIEPCVAVNDGYSWCNVWGTVVSLDGFCHKGAKMDGGANDE